MRRESAYRDGSLAEGARMSKSWTSSRFSTHTNGSRADAVIRPIRFSKSLCWSKFHTRIVGGGAYGITDGWRLEATEIFEIESDGKIAEESLSHLAVEI